MFNNRTLVVVAAVATVAAIMVVLIVAKNAGGPQHATPQATQAKP
jgi:hypothetical protein